MSLNNHIKANTSNNSIHSPLQGERGVYAFVGCVFCYVVVSGHFILLQLCLGDGNYAPWRGECVFLLGVSVFMWLLVVVLFV